jgi:hypothetical protein
VRGSNVRLIHVKNAAQAYLIRAGPQWIERALHARQLNIARRSLLAAAFYIMIYGSTFCIKHGSGENIEHCLCTVS